MWGASPPTFLKAFPGPRGRPDLKNAPPKNPARLPSGTQRFIGGGGDFRIPNCHEMALELICGADFWCNRHCRTSPVVLEGFWGTKASEFIGFGAMDVKVFCSFCSSRGCSLAGILHLSYFGLDRKMATKWP